MTTPTSFTAALEVPKWAAFPDRETDATEQWIEITGTDDACTAFFSAEEVEDEELIPRGHGRVGFRTTTATDLTLTGIALTDETGHVIYRDRDWCLTHLGVEFVYGVEQWEMECAA